MRKAVAPALWVTMVVAHAACGEREDPLGAMSDIEGPMTSALTKGAPTASPIELLRARSRNYMSWGGSSWTHSDYTMLVQNLAYRKEVGVRLRQQQGRWTDLPARYIGRADEGREIWRAEVEEGRDGVSLPDHHEFALWYRVNGVTYWDNNRGANFRLERNDGSLLGASTPVLLYNASSCMPPITRAMKGLIDLRNLDYRKHVEVVYTQDGWRTAHSLPAQWLAGPNAQGVETWGFESGDLDLDSVQFAISYSVAGRTYWDNNFAHGRDYRLVPSTPTNVTCCAKRSANGAATDNACWW